MTLKGTIHGVYALCKLPPAPFRKPPNGLQLKACWE